MEKSFKIGDCIKVGNTIGTISSIDLLSVKILTPNNTLIRIPNETIIKSEITNITRFENRRLDLALKISHEEDLKKAKELLLDIIKKNKLSLKTPLPSISIREIGSAGIYLTLSVWVNQKEHDMLADTLYEEIATAFKEKNIQM